MSQSKITTMEIEAVSDGESDVQEPDSGPDLETDNQDSSDNEEENASMDVDESQNNNKPVDSEADAAEAESDSEKDEWVDLEAKGPIKAEDIESEDVELWLLKVPQDFEVTDFANSKSLRFHKIPHITGELASISVARGDDSQRQYSVVSAEPIEYQTLLNVFPGRDGHNKRRLMLGKPFSKMLTFVETVTAKIDKHQSEADVLRRHAPVQPEKLYVRYVPPGAKRPQEVPNPILSKRKREAEADTPNKKAKTGARDTPSKPATNSSTPTSPNVFKTPEPVARKKSASSMKDGATQSTNTSPTKTVEAPASDSKSKKDKAGDSPKKAKKDKESKASEEKKSDKKDKASDSDKKDKTGDSDKTAKKEQVKGKEAAQKDKSNASTPSASPAKKDKKKKRKNDKKKQSDE